MSWWFNLQLLQRCAVCQIRQLVKPVASQTPEKSAKISGLFVVSIFLQSLQFSCFQTEIIWKLDNVGAVHVDQLQVWSSGEVGERVYTPRTSQQSENVSMKIYEDV